MSAGRINRCFVSIVKKRYVQRTSLKKVLSFFFCGPCAVCVKTSVRSHSAQILRSGIKPPGDRSLRNWSWNVICCHRTKLFSRMPVNHHGHFCPQAPQTSYRLVLLQDKGQSSGSQLVPPNPEALGGPGLRMRISWTWTSSLFELTNLTWNLNLRT